MSWTNIDNKEKIVEQYIPLVKYIASRIMIGRSTYIEYEDLVSYGMIGLMDAISKFDPDKGIKFSSYASIRIKGEMIDQIRKARPISKGAMDKLAKYNEAIDALQNRLLREPIIDEIAEYLNITVSEVADIEIGKVLEVSESRVCQLHSRAIKNLRVMLQKINYIEV